MDAKSARRLIEEVCKEAPVRSSLGRALRPAGFAIMLGIGILGCNGGDAYGMPVDAMPPAGDAYGVVMDAGVDAMPPGGDAYGIPSDGGE